VTSCFIDVRPRSATVSYSRTSFNETIELFSSIRIILDFGAMFAIERETVTKGPSHTWLRAVEDNLKPLAMLWRVEEDN